MSPHLPASTELLGVLVDALKAARYARGAKACVLRDRTSRRCFAGSVRTRLWCCRLSGLLEFLPAERLVDDSRADNVTRALGMFIPFAAAMLRWDCVREAGVATARAHLRLAALEFATKLQVLGHAGLDFGIADEPTDTPPWVDASRRHEPLSALRAAAGAPALRAIADATGFAPHAVGRWFSKGERPGREALQVLAKYFAKAFGRDWAPLYRNLYWHYALADALRLLDRWLPPGEVNEIGRVCAAVARCRGRATEPPPIGLVIGATLIAPPRIVVVHAIHHGASRDWADDAADVEAALAQAGVHGIHEPAAQLDFALTRLPRRRARKRRPSAAA